MFVLRCLPALLYWGVGTAAFFISSIFLTMKQSCRLQLPLLFCLSFAIQSLTKANPPVFFKPVCAQVVQFRKPSLDAQFKDYTVFKLDVNNLTKIVEETPDEANIELAVGCHTWFLQIQPSHLVAQNYRLIVEENGVTKTIAGSAPKAYKGQEWASGKEVRLVFNSGFVEGFISDNETTWYIEPLSHFQPDAQAGLFILYPEQAVVQNSQFSCLMTETENWFDQNSTTQGKAGAASFNGSCGLAILVAIASDKSMFTKYGSVVAVENHNLAVLNNAQTLFTGVFYQNISFEVATQFIVTGNNPWTTPANMSDCLSKFRTWANNGGFGISYGLAQLWTNLNTLAPAGSGSLAYQSSLCTSNKYCLVKDNSSNSSILRYNTAHAIGYILGASYDVNCPPNNYVMCQTIGTPPSTWSPSSVAAINAFLPGKSEAGCISGMIQVTNIVSTGLTGSFVISGGLPQIYSPPFYSSLTMALQGNPGVTATLETAPFEHGQTVSFTCPQAGTYTVVATDAGGCTGAGSITVTAAQSCSVPAPNMVAVEGGTFTMGCTAEQEPDCNMDEKPAHEVTLSDFEIGKYEVTQGEWAALMGSNPSSFKACGADCPVEQVSWYNSVVYCNRLSECLGFMPCYYADAAFTQVFGKNGSTWSFPNSGDVYWKKSANGYRLPTEAEWEYAARAGGAKPQTSYSGDNNLDAVGWHPGNSQVVYTPNVGGKGTHPKGSKSPNGLGLYDMSGNVFEACFDWYGNTYYANSPACMPYGENSGFFIVLRSGSWYNSDCRVADRQVGPRNGIGNSVGFRLARTPIPTPPPCVTALTHPTNGATSVALTTAIEWAKVLTATGYRLSLGTAPGGTQLLNNQDLGDTTRYNPIGCLPQNTTVHVSLTPYNADGSATGCTGFSFTTGSGVPEMVLVPGGTIKLGGQPPVTPVTIDSFLIGRYEVTQCEWAGLMGSNPSFFPGCGGDCPVEWVSWYNVIVFCNRLSIQQGLTPVYRINGSTNPNNWGAVPTNNNNATWDAVVVNWNAKGYRLPTEAEWEYAARGASNTPDYLYAGSNTADEVSWYSGNSPNDTKPVGQKRPNGLKVYDMSGNVWEWCWDWDSVPFPSTTNNPTGPVGGTDRIYRGGAWFYTVTYSQIARRGSSLPPGQRSSSYGFRLARKP